MIPFKPYENISGAFLGQDFSQLESWGLGVRDLILLKQVHGDRILEIQGPEDVENIRGEEGDAIISCRAGVPIAVKSADCVPILLAHPEGVVAAVHSGWKGSVKNILAKTLRRMKDHYELDLDRLKLAIGPAISMKNYEVGEEVAENFFWLKEKGIIGDLKNGKFLLDLPGANRELALQEGLKPSQIQMESPCTFDHPKEFYSYRRALKEGKKKARGRNYSWIMVNH